MSLAHASDPTPLLSELEVAILAFERQWVQPTGAKEQQIRATFGMSAPRYYQHLNRIIDIPAALAHDPLLVKRLHRLRERRRRERTASTQGISLRA